MKIDDVFKTLRKYFLFFPSIKGLGFNIKRSFRPTHTVSSLWEAPLASGCNPKNLLNKLEIIIGSIKVGNTSKQIRKEGLMILNILLKSKVLNKSQYAKLFANSAGGLQSTSRDWLVAIEIFDYPAILRFILEWYKHLT